MVDVTTLPGFNSGPRPGTVQSCGHHNRLDDILVSAAQVTGGATPRPVGQHRPIRTHPATGRSTRIWMPPTKPHQTTPPSTSTSTSEHSLVHPPFLWPSSSVRFPPDRPDRSRRLPQRPRSASRRKRAGNTIVTGGFAGPRTRDDAPSFPSASQTGQEITVNHGQRFQLSTAVDRSNVLVNLLSWRPREDSNLRHSI